MFIDPAAQYVRVQSIGKRHRSHRYARGQAGRDRISLEFATVLSPTASTVSLINKCVHVSTLNSSWTRSSYTTLHRSRCVPRTHTFNHYTLAEDADLTLAIRKLGYTIAYEDEAIG